MKLAMLSPVDMSHSESAKEQKLKRQGFLNSVVPSGVEITLIDNPGAPEAIQTMQDEYLSVPGLIAQAVAAQNNFDGIITGCFGEPGLDAIRELVDVPVVGCCGPALHMANLLGKRFSVLSPLKSTVPSTVELIERYGIAHLASVRSLDIPVLEIRKNRELAVERAASVARDTIEKDGADTLVLGCMSLAYQDVAKDISEKLGVPVVNPLYAAIETAVYLVRHKLVHSPLIYRL